MDQTTELPHLRNEDYRQLRQMTTALGDQAKFFWGASIFTKLGWAVAGVLLTLLKLSTEYSVLLTLTVVFVSELMGVWSDTLKSSSEGLRRKLDYWDGLDKTMSSGEIRDLKSELPRSTAKLVKKRTTAASQPSTVTKKSQAYFASQQPPGAARLANNIYESAWWSKSLASGLARICWGILAVLVILMTLNMAYRPSVHAPVHAALSASSSPSPTPSASHAQTSPGTQAEMNRLLLDRQSAIATVFGALLSGGILRLAIGYDRFASKSKATAEKLDSMLSKTLEENQVLAAVQDYHLARSSAPMIPTSYWSMREGHLNELWDEHCKRVAPVSEGN
jgi:hypothetical protein